MKQIHIRRFLSLLLAALTLWAAAVTAARTEADTAIASGAAFSRLNEVTGRPSLYAYRASNSTW